MNHPSPEVLIGIPTLNGPDRLQRCLRSIKLHTPPSEPFKVLVVDDFSSPENLEKNKGIVSGFGIEMITHQQRFGVARGWNDLTRHSNARFVILMNDDVEVVPDWYEALVFSIKNNPGAGMVGLTAYQGVNSLNFTPPPAKSYNEAKMLRGVGMFSTTGFLFGFERAKFDHVVGFDDGFFLFYEEIDFGARLEEAGWRSYMLSYPVVIHQGGASTSDSRNVQNTQKILAESRDRFKAKHGSVEAVRMAMAGRDKDSKPTELVEWNTSLKVLVD
jgi:GT2 family glycosyltransferase